MKNNKHMATVILALFTVGFLVSYPFHHYFWMGLISAVCAASMIGGLADWFAVTAIFRKPLRLTWPSRIFRTEIIPKNREGIVRGIVDIVENDLLSRSSIQAKIEQLELSRLMETYSSDPVWQQELDNFVARMFQLAYTTLTPEQVEELVAKGLLLTVDSVDLSSAAENLLLFARETGYEQRVLSAGIDLVTGFVKQEKIHLFVTNFIEQVLEEYQKDSPGRAMAIKMALNFMLKKSPSELAVLAENYVNDSLHGLKDRSNPAREKLEKALQELAGTANVWLRPMLEGIVTGDGSERFALGKLACEGFESFRLKHPDIVLLIGRDRLHQWISILRTELLRKAASQDASLKKVLIEFVDSRHDLIGRIVRDNINQYSTEELVALIEGVAGNDLQMIRINGSVVGGLVGLLTYLITIGVR